MHPPTARIFGLPAATSLPKNPPEEGVKADRAHRVGRYSALRSRALPALVSRVRRRTVAPERSWRVATLA